jgi:LPS-assembly lipoprotein
MSWSDTRRLRGVALLLLAVLSGCGFHLRGDVKYPAGMATTYIEATDRYTPFYQELRATLREGGVALTSDAANAGAIVRVLSDETGQRVLSVSVRNTPLEYEVYYVIRYSLEIGGKEALSAQRLALTREYTYDETLVLGKAEEEDTLRRALAQDLVGLVTRRLASAH